MTSPPEPSPGGPEFTYRTRAVHVRFSPGAARQVDAEVDTLGALRPFVVTTPGRRVLVSHLTTRPAEVFSDAQPHVPAEVVAEALMRLRGHEADVLVAVGGGSAIGLAKALALETGLPIVALPTTYSGSEMTAVWGVSDGAGKRTGIDDRVAPRTVLYDPEWTVSLPSRISAASGMNAAAHCVEALYAVDANPLSSLLAEEGLRRLARSLPCVIQDPGGLRDRADALYGAHLAGRALDMTSMGLHHKLCHVLGGTFGLPHAQVHALLLPYVAAYNAPTVPEAMRRVARALGDTDAPAPAALFRLNRALGLSETLQDLGLESADLDRAADLALEARYPNPREVRWDDLRNTLQEAWIGHPPT